MIARMRQVMFDWTAAFRVQPEPAEPAPGVDAEAPAASSARPPRFDGEASVLGGGAGVGLTREQTVDRILAINPTAGDGFLEHFSDEHLRHYLDRLVGAGRPRGRDARWVRRPESRAAVVHVRLA